MNQKEISECVILKKKGASSFIIYRQSTSQAWGLCNIDEFSLASDIEVAYLLLGLEAAEAVDSANKEIERLRALLPSAQEARQVIGLANHTIEQLRSSLDSEKARAAKLVEALEKISKQVVRVGIDNMWAVQNKFQEIADAALAAHKKGGNEA